jgi:GxxExxY protein
LYTEATVRNLYADFADLSDSAELKKAMEGEMNKLIYADLTYRIRSALYEVHTILGPGFREETYRKALLAELKTKGIEFETEKEIPILYQGNPIDIYRMDLVVAGVVVLELKAVEDLQPRHEAQLISYLRASGLPVGLLVNFGETSLRIVRRVNQKFREIRGSSA